MKRYKSSAEPPSSASVVESNDDLLIKILLRLPVFSLNVFKSVSKRWLTLITNPTFTLHRSQSHILDPPSGIFLWQEQRSLHEFIPLDIRIPSHPSPTTFTLKFDSDEVMILQSCNGMLLCRTRTSTRSRTGTGKLYVYNPSLNLFTTIPQCHYPEHSIPRSGYLRMAFDPTKSPHYKILYVEDIGYGDDTSIRIQTYSSKTGNWSVCGDKFSFRCSWYFSSGLYWNDAIHWLGNDLHFELDVEHLSLTSIETPRALDEKKSCEQKLFESGGCLLLCKEHIQGHLNIYEMSKRYSGWLVKYTVNLDDNMIMKYRPKPGWEPQRHWFCSCVLCVMIGENEEDSFLVMEIFGKLIQYKIVLKTIREVCNLKPCEHPTSFQFIASFADV